MRLADQMLLAQIREALLGHIPDQQWALVEQEVEKAGGVDKVDGYTGVLLRDAIEKAKKNKVETVMSEFKAGKLKSSSGKKVKSRKQAIAIALSEQRRVKKEMLEKASFGGDRSAAGRYAAEQRWKGHAKSDKPSGKTSDDPRFGKLGEDYVLKPQQAGDRVAQVIIRTGISQHKLAQPSREQIDRIKDEIREEGGLSWRGSNKADWQQVVEAETSRIGAIDADRNATIEQRRAALRDIGRAKAVIAAIEEIEGESRDKQTVQSDKGEAPATGDDRLIVRRPDLLPEEAFRDKTQFKNFRQTETYNKIVQNKKAEIVRGKDGAASHRGSNLTAARDNLAMEEEMLRSFESGERSARKILGSPFKKTEARAILQARVANASATVQALEEFEDETSPGYFAS